MRTIQLISLLLLFSVHLAAQQISGLALDKESKEPVEGVTIFDHQRSFTAITNNQGNFYLPVLPSDSIEIFFQHISYKTTSKVIKPKEKTIIVFIEKKTLELEELIVESEQEPESLNRIKLTPEGFKSLPQNLGETDLLSGLKSQTGIAQAGDLNAGLFVRGSTHSQNYIELDGAPVYNPHHMLPMASVFNDLIIKDLNIEKAGFNVARDGALSSFISLSGKSAIDSARVIGSISLISTKLAAGGELSPHLRWLLGGRTTYYNHFANIYNRLSKDNRNPLPGYRFEDLNLKITSDFINRISASLSAFVSADHYNDPKMKDLFDIQWQNKFVSANIDYHVSDKSTFKSTIGVSQYLLDIDNVSDSGAKGENLFNSFIFKNDYRSYLGNNIFFQTGISYFRHQFDLSRKSNSENDPDRDSKSSDRLSVYTALEFPLTSSINFSSGLNINGFRSGKTLLKLSPRVNLSWRMGNFVQYISYDKAHQFLHTLPLINYNLPFSLWRPSGTEYQPQSLDQLSYSATFSNTALSAGIGLYKRWLKNINDYKEGINPYNIASDQLISGNGKSYGIECEFGLKRTWFESFTVSYALSEVKHQFQDINKGMTFHPPFDIRHQLNVSFIKSLKKGKADVSVSWYYNSGEPYTYPESIVYYQGPTDASSKPIPVYGDRYNINMPARHRLDAAISFYFNHNWGNSTLKLGVSNVYNQANPYLVTFEIEKEEDYHKIVPVQRSLIPLMPILSYEFQIK